MNHILYIYPSLSTTSPVLNEIFHQKYAIKVLAEFKIIKISLLFDQFKYPEIVLLPSDFCSFQSILFMI